MSPRSQRLSAEQFNSVMEKGRVSHSSLFLMRAVPGMIDTRIAAVAPKKVAKTAVARNKMRRKLYEALRALRNGSSIAPGVHAIVFAKPSVGTARQADIVVDIKNLFVKGGLLR